MSFPLPTRPPSGLPGGTTGSGSSHVLAPTTHSSSCRSFRSITGCTSSLSRLCAFMQFARVIWNGYVPPPASVGRRQVMYSCMLPAGGPSLSRRRRSSSARRSSSSARRRSSSARRCSSSRASLSRSRSARSACAVTQSAVGKSTVVVPRSHHTSPGSSLSSQRAAMSKTAAHATPATIILLMFRFSLFGCVWLADCEAAYFMETPSLPATRLLPNRRSARGPAAGITAHPGADADSVRSGGASRRRDRPRFGSRHSIGGGGRPRSTVRSKASSAVCPPGSVAR